MLIFSLIRFQATYGTALSAVHGQANGATNYYSFNLAAHEYITSVISAATVVLPYVVCYLQLTTSTGAVYTIDAGCQTPKISATLENGVQYINGRSGDYVDNMQFIYY